MALLGMTVRGRASETPSSLTTGTPGTASCFVPQNLTSFKNSTKSWVGFSGGQHHTICMDSEGRTPKSCISETVVPGWARHRFASMRVVLVLQSINAWGLCRVYCSSRSQRKKRPCGPSHHLRVATAFKSMRAHLVCRLFYVEYTPY